MRPAEWGRRRTSTALLTGLAGLAVAGLVGCGDDAAYEKVEPYELTPIADGVNQVVLTPEASDRLVMQTAAITEEGLNGTARLTVPYASLIYDTSGGTWVYTHPAPLTYVRAPVSVDRIEGDRVYLTDGPPPGTEVAVTSVAELYGTDTGVGK